MKYHCAPFSTVSDEQIVSLCGRDVTNGRFWTSPTTFLTMCENILPIYGPGRSGPYDTRCRECNDMLDAAAVGFAAAACGVARFLLSR